MGRNRKPVALKEGHLTQIEKAKAEIKEELVKAPNKNIKAPTWLKDSFAKKEFKKLSTMLQDIGIITELDINNLAGYCMSYSKYVQATQELEGQPLVVEKELSNGSYTVVANPLVKITKDYANEMRKFASLVGLTLDSRLKIADSLLQKQEDEIFEGFGDI